MDEALVANWNAVVHPEDHVYNLGDVTIKRGGVAQQEWFCTLNRRLNGHKRLFLGNHDHWPAEVYLRAGFEKLLATWRDDHGVVYSHFPLHPSTLYGVTANVHGHTHEVPDIAPAVFEYPLYNTGKLKQDRPKLEKPWVVPYVNICVEHTSYRPISWDELELRINKVKESYAV